ncbi:MAG: glycosyltransferase family protein [Magnetococcales bacterium]|nr:glycosyltransferase family protein [Magnetococcales bacterium]
MVMRQAEEGLVALFAQGQWAELEGEAGRLVALHSGHGFFRTALGVALRMQGRHEEAIAELSRAVELTPGDEQNWTHLASSLLAQNRHDEAEGLLRRAMERDPGAASVRFHLGNLLRQRQRPGEAEACFREGLRLAPGEPDPWCNLGLTLAEQGRFGEAEACYREALRLAPGDVVVWINLGVLLKDAERWSESEAALRRALALDPACADAWNRLGILLGDWPEDRRQEAEAAYREAVRVNPDHADAAYNLALLYQRMGRFAASWPWFEARMHPAKSDRVGMRTVPPDLPFPMWRGEDLAGKAVLVLPEQGLGDLLQYCRFVPMLKARGALRVTVVCPGALLPLFVTLEGVDLVLDSDRGEGAQGGHDFWVFMLSLPGRLGVGVTAAIPYLGVPEGRRAEWEVRLPGGAMRVGLVWRGNPAHPCDAWRSLPGLAVLAPLWRIPGVVFIGLQKGAGEEEAWGPPPGQSLWHAGGMIRDCADTAAILSCLDLLITIDSAPAHLAGALGRPCWVLLPFRGADSRWMSDCEVSPWYPGGMRLFRQTLHGDWAGVVARVCEALRQEMRSPRG